MPSMDADEVFTLKWFLVRASCDSATGCNRATDKKPLPLLLGPTAPVICAPFSCSSAAGVPILYVRCGAGDAVSNGAKRDEVPVVQQSISTTLACGTAQTGANRQELATTPHQQESQRRVPLHRK